jgi:hypothetical protein
MARFHSHQPPRNWPSPRGLSPGSAPDSLQAVAPVYLGATNPDPLAGRGGGVRAAPRLEVSSRGVPVSWAKTARESYLSRAYTAGRAPGKH